MDRCKKIDYIQIAIDIITSNKNPSNNGSIRDSVIERLENKELCTMENILSCEVAIRTIEYVAKNGFSQIQSQLILNSFPSPQPVITTPGAMENIATRPLFDRLTWMERIPPNSPLTSLFIDMTSGSVLASHIFYGHLNRFLMSLMKWLDQVEPHVGLIDWRQNLIRSEPIDILAQNLLDAIRVLTIFNRRYIIRNVALLFHYEKACDTFKELANALLANMAERANTPEWNVQFAMIDRQLLSLSIMSDTLLMSHSFHKHL